MDELRAIFTHPGPALFVLAAMVGLVLWVSLRTRDTDPLALYDAGHLSEALTRTRAMVPEFGEAALANTAVCLLTAAGRYTEALAWARRPPSPNFEGGAIVVINGAEAAYNLGRWGEAEAMLAPLEPASLEPWMRTGLRCQRAWICAHWGRADEALAWVDQADIDALPFAYRAEWHFTRAVALWAKGDLSEAVFEVERGRSASTRASSKRNALALRGRIEQAAGNLADAELHLRAAADHPYRWQGGEGLLALGLLLRDTQRADEAKALLARVLNQDPESEAAEQAAALLGVPAPSPFPPWFAVPAAPASS